MIKRLYKIFFIFICILLLKSHSHAFDIKARTAILQDFSSGEISGICDGGSPTTKLVSYRRRDLPEMKSNCTNIVRNSGTCQSHRQKPQNPIGQLAPANPH